MDPQGGYSQGAGTVRSGTARPHPLLVALATIGALALMVAALFFLLLAWLSSGGVEVAGVRESAPGIGIVELKGVIADPEPVLKFVRKLRARGDVKAVVVRINSPGGAVGASQEIFQALKDLDEKKPVVASLDSVAASGGYYAALGARKIVSNPGTITGSIGVIMRLPNLGPLLEKVGIQTQVMKSGTYKDVGSITRPMTQEEKAMVRVVLEDVHAQFMEDVSERRGIPIEKVKEIAQGQIYSGRQAKALGLVDELGNLDTAISIAKRLSNIKGEPRLVYPEKGRFERIREILEGALSGGLRNIFERTVFEYAT